MKAFPTDYFYDDETKHEILPSEGMDLRDYFAARAMQGMLSLTPEQLYTAFGNEPTTLKESVAKNAYTFADAMMKARETK